MSRTRVLTLQQGEDLRAVAARELGSATRWTEIARINGLRLPFIVASYHAADRLPHTLMWGDRFLIPWPANAVLPPTAISTHGLDVAMTQGQLQATADGDLATVGGEDNLIQALTHRLKTLLGELTYHTRYGCNVALALGLPAAPFASLMASAWVSEAIKAEPRVFQIHYVKSEVVGDSIQVTAKITLVGNNSPTDVNMVLNP
jgi:phage baseplate assembly protein W